MPTLGFNLQRHHRVTGSRTRALMLSIAHARHERHIGLGTLWHQIASTTVSASSRIARGFRYSLSIVMVQLLVARNRQPIKNTSTRSAMIFSTAPYEPPPPPRSPVISVQAKESK